MKHFAAALAVLFLFLTGFDCWLRGRRRTDIATPTRTRKRASPGLLAAMTLPEKIPGRSAPIGVPRLGLRLSGHIEGLHGVALGGPAEWGRRPDGVVSHGPLTTTQFPQQVGLGETWDPDLVRRVAALEGARGAVCLSEREVSARRTRRPRAE